MKKLIVMLAFVVAGATAVNAQSAFNKGDLVADLGLTYAGSNGLGVHGGLEFGLADHIGGLDWLGWGAGFGLELGLGDVIYLGPGVRTALHFDFIEGLDLYLGAAASYGFALSSNGGDGHFAVGGFGGLRYFFTPTIGLFLEGGYPTLGAIGVTFKL